MVKLLHFLFGRLHFEITGQNVERFLNLCAKNDVVLWDLKASGKGYQFFIRKRSGKSLENLAEKTKIQMKLLGRYGLPFFLLEHRKRKILFFSIFMAFMAMFTMSQFIWEITVSGCEVYSESAILKYVTTNYYKAGIYKKKIDCNQLEEHLREDYEEIAWVSCSLQGTRLHVEIKETLDRKTKQNPKKPCDIVANKSGTVTGVTVKSGTPLVSQGDKIKKGSTLISGLIYYYSDDFQVTETDKIKADGEITMQTRESYKETIPMEYYEKKVTKTEKKLKSIYVGDYQWKLPQKALKSHVNVIEKKYPIKIGASFYLPVGIYRRTYQSYDAEKKTDTNQQAEAKLKARLEKYIKEKKAKGIKIVRCHVEYEKKGNHYTASGTIIQEEKVGKIRNIRALTKKQEEKITPTTAQQ